MPQLVHPIALNLNEFDILTTVLMSNPETRDLS